MKRSLLALCSALLLSACGREQPKSEKKPQPVKAPEVYRVRMETTKGDVVLEIHRDWAPRGADRFYELVQQRFYDGARFFRVVPRFVVQFGLKGDPAVDAHWSRMSIPDDPVRQNNSRGTITYAMAGPATRTTQVFINLQDNFVLDKQGFAPFGKVVEGMDVVEKFYRGYGDAPPGGVGPEQSRIRSEGNAYLERYFPNLDYITRAVIEQ